MVDHGSWLMRAMIDTCTCCSMSGNSCAMQARYDMVGHTTLLAVLKVGEGVLRLQSTPPPLEILPPRGGNRHLDNSFFQCAPLFFLCWCPLLVLAPLCIQTQMYAIGVHVWYHSRTKATVIGPSPAGPEFLHIQY